MAIELYWDNDDQTVMLVEVRGDFSWEAMYDALGKIKKVADRSPVVMGAILDVSEGINFPGGSVFNSTGLQHAKNMLAMGKDGTGPCVVVGARGMLRKVFDWIKMMDGEGMKMISLADTLDEARAKLERQGYSYLQHALAVGD